MQAKLYQNTWVHAGQKNDAGAAENLGFYDVKIKTSV
jgi:hypothetical protein